MEEKKEEKINVEDTDKQPQATFLNSVATSVRLSDGSLRHVHVSIFEDDATHDLRIYYDVIDPKHVKF